MTLQTPLRSRLIIGIAGSASALLFLCITVYGLVWQHEAAAALGFVMVGVFGLTAYYWGRAATLQADDSKVAYYQPLGRPRLCSRGELAAIDRVFQGRGIYQIQLKNRDGKVLFGLDHDYRQADMERLATYLGVPLRWDVDP